jgi:U3 small nucleolar RNA-associated protein 14
MENEKVKTVDLVKPGWGGWAGAGIDMEEAKRKILKKSRRNNRRTRHKLIIRPQDLIKTEEDKKLLVRRDKNLDHVIISEKKDAMIAKYQVGLLKSSVGMALGQTRSDRFWSFNVLFKCGSDFKFKLSNKFRTK